MASYTIVLVDDDKSILEVVASMLESPEYEIFAFTDPNLAIDAALRHQADLVISDLKMSPIDGMEVLRRIKKEMPQTEVLLTTAHASVESAVAALKEGAFDYLIKPVKMEELRNTVSHILAHEEVRRENRYLKNQLEEKFGLDSMIGKSPAMQKIFYLLQKVAATDLTVLIYGESGTGKELVAKAIHYRSTRKDKPFVAVNCGAIPEQLLESELFGHVKGAFTGAVVDKKGLFGEANGGTIFLDEISATSPGVQVSLLRVLQEREFRRVGEAKNSKTDVRVLAATNIDLEVDVKKQQFREDLYYRLSVVHIRLPALRERKDDIPLLVEHFLAKYAGQSQPKKLQEGVLPALLAYDWPGNIRELENMLQGAASLSESNTITLADLPDKITKSHSAKAVATHCDHPNLKEFLNSQEKVHIEKILAASNRDKKKAAGELGISLPSLYRKIEQLGISQNKPTDSQQ